MYCNECTCLGQVLSNLPGAEASPIIEPEVLMDGDHDARRCYEVTAEILDATFSECESQGVHIPGAC